ncbi:hypothetical protein PARU111607_10965 [Palleronia rufa]
MDTITQTVIAVYAIGFGLGLCGVALVFVINWLDARDD